MSFAQTQLKTVVGNCRLNMNHDSENVRPISWTKDVMQKVPLIRVTISGKCRNCEFV